MEYKCIIIEKKLKKLVYTYHYMCGWTATRGQCIGRFRYLILGSAMKVKAF
jgi:hypothetical protein